MNKPRYRIISQVRLVEVTACIAVVSFAKTKYLQLATLIRLAAGAKLTVLRVQRFDPRQQY
eukprot:scaffold678016_cov59-Prasinocladus_malaysianus.AAC.1